MTSGYVYYVERDRILHRDPDELIKIGFSRAPERRAASLQSTILATEEGSMLLERMRHRQFADLAVGGEWFRPGHRLLAHIAFLRSGSASSPVPRVPTEAQRSDLLRAAEVAELCGVTTATVHRWAAEGVLGAVRLGEKAVRFRRSEIDRFIERAAS